MRLLSSKAGRIVVEHEDGYVFTFQIHDIDLTVLDLVDVTWAAVSAPPDADDLELAARRVAETEAVSQGWL